MTFAKYPVLGGGGGGGDITGPGSSVNNGLVLWNGTGGDVIKDGGVGAANQVLLSNGTTPVFGSIANANVDASAAIAYSKLSLGNSIVNSDISPSAGIALTKINSVTANRALQSNGAGNIQASSVTSTELGYLSGVTSAIQTQLNAKLNLSGGTMTGALSVANSVTLSGSASAADYRWWKNGTNMFMQYNSSAAFQIQESGGNRAALFGPGGYADIGNASSTSGTHQFTTGIASLPVLYLQNAASAVSLLGFRNNSSTVGVIGASDVDYFAVWDTSILNKQLSVATTGAIAIGATGFTGTHAVTGNVAFDTDTLFVDAANNRVGVGTASPAAKLNVVDSGGIGFEVVPNFTGSTVRLLSYNRTSSAYVPVRHDASEHFFDTSGGNKGAISSAGAWTLGPSGGGVRHVISGAYSVGPENVNSSATSQNNYNVGDTSWLESIAGATFTGFAAKENGRVLHIVGYNGSITINHDSASSTSTNRVILQSGANTTSRGFTLIYSSTGGRWMQVG